MTATLSAPVETCPTALPACHVLVVDDNEINRELAGLMLTDAGAKVSFAADGGEAVLLATSGRYEVILLDMQMPVMNGLEVTRRLRQAGNTTPVIAVTASVDAALSAAWKRAGLNALLTKPASQQQMVSAIQQVTAEKVSKQKLTLPCRLDLNNPRYREFVNTFVAKLKCRLTGMEADTASGNFASLKEHAHWLAGTGPTLGYDQFAAPAHALSKAASDQNIDAINVAIAKCRELWQRLPSGECKV